MRGLVYMASRDKVDMDTLYKGIQYALERLGESKFGFKSTTVSKFKSKSPEGSGNELVDYSRAPCLGADQKARGLWERNCCGGDEVHFGGLSERGVIFPNFSIKLTSLEQNLQTLL